MPELQQWWLQSRGLVFVFYEHPFKKKKDDEKSDDGDDKSDKLNVGKAREVNFSISSKTRKIRLKEAVKQELYVRKVQSNNPSFHLISRNLPPKIENSSVPTMLSPVPIPMPMPMKMPFVESLKNEQSKLDTKHTFYLEGYTSYSLKINEIYCFTHEKDGHFIFEAVAPVAHDPELLKKCDIKIPTNQVSKIFT